MVMILIMELHLFDIFTESSGSWFVMSVVFFEKKKHLDVNIIV